MKLVFFDFDGTLTKHDSFIGFLRFYSGNVKFIFFAFLCLPILFMWGIKIIDATTAKTKILNFYIKGHQENFIKSKGVEYVGFLLRGNLFKSDVFDKLKEHISNNDKCIVVSASIDVWIKPFAELMNIEYLCTNLHYENGFYKGLFSTKNCKGQEKVNRILKSIEMQNYSEIVAYGNSKDDIEMMELAHVKHWIR